MELPNEIWYHVLGFCDTFRDFKNWSLVCKDWSEMIECKNVLKSNLDEEIENMLQSNKGFHHLFINKTGKRNTITLSFEKPISTLFFTNWGPKPIITDMKMYINYNKIATLSGHYSWNTGQPYCYASKMPEYNNTGYTCVNSFGDNVNRVELIYKYFQPILIAYKFFDN